MFPNSRITGGSPWQPHLDFPHSCCSVCVCILSWLIDGWLPFIWVGSLAHSSVRLFPRLRFLAPLLLLFDHPFAFFPPQPSSFSSWEVCAPPPGLQCLVWILHKDKCGEKQERRGGPTSLCYRRERFTSGHKSCPERERAIAHIEGSVCGDTEVNWPGQSESWTALMHHLHALPSPIHALPSGLGLLSFGQNTTLSKCTPPHSVFCFI